jgi:cell division protein FtsL
MVHERQHETTVNKSARQTRELVRRIGKLTEAQAAMSWGIILLVLALVGVIYLSQTIKVAAIGRHVQQLEIELSDVQGMNTQIKREIAEAQSLDRMHDEMDHLEFVPATALDTEYLVITDYPEMVMAQGYTPDHQEKRSQPVDTIQEALHLVLYDRLDDLMRGESGE